MEILLMTVGRTTIDFVKTGIAEYLKRLKQYIPYSILELPDVKRAGHLSANEQKEAEGELILGSLKPTDYVILLDEHGREYRSVEFASAIEKIMASGCKRCVFVVGGAYGFSGRVYDRTPHKISLSRMTFNHEMVRLFFTEQVYRAMTILRGEPYHHE